jgi:hypothetical protein
MTLPDLRALLIRQQAESLQVDKELNATPIGTQKFGDLRNRRQQLGIAINTTKQRIAAAQKGRQSSLL